MTQPKFSVGEVVILQSESCPELNGETTVISRKYEEKWVDNITGGFIEGWGYKLDVSDTIWSEKSLRKKHDPGEMTFEGLMMSLNNPVNVES